MVDHAGLLVGFTSDFLTDPVNEKIFIAPEHGVPA